MSSIQLNEQLLDQKLARLEEARSWSSRVISKLETMIRTADDYSLFRVNPLQYAKDKGMADAEAVELFLHASKAGLFEMEWHLVCASCCSVVSSFRALAQVHSHFVCSICAAVNEANLDDYIQVSFTLSTQIRDIAYRHPETLSIDELYMKYYLSKDVMPFADGRMLYDVILTLTKGRGYLPPGETTVFELDAQPGILHIGDTLNSTGVGFAVTPNPAQQVQTIQLQLADGKFRVTNMALPDLTMFNGMFNVQFDQFGQIAAGKVRVEVENVSERRGALWMLNFGADNPPPTPELAPFLSGKRLLSTQSFRDLFRSEVVSSEEGLGVKDITVLFTDLKGSTAIYEKIGDPQAFFLVRQHFDALGRVIVRHSGAIVKTIGDAVMATFLNPLDAVNAAIEMLSAIDDFNQGIAEKMILKIGIHRGHSIAVTLNDRLDYFGQMVNIASRVQGLAEAGEVYMTQDVYSFPGIAKTLQEYNVEPESAAIRGIRDKMSVYRVTAKGQDT